MMKYIIKEKIFTITNKFAIKDIEGRDAYKVEGRFFTLGKKLSIYDNSGVEVLFIKEKLLKILKEYYFYEDGIQVCKIKKRFSLFKPKFNIQGKNGRYKIDGSIFKHDFSIKKDGKSVARVSKKWISLSDSYVIDIEDEEDQVLMLGIVIVLDQIFYDGISSTSSSNVNE